MKTEVKGSKSNRFWIMFSAIFLGLLFLGLLNFILDDLAKIQEPDYYKIEKTHLGRELLDQEKTLKEQIETYNNHVQRLSDNQQYIKNNSNNLKTTIDQMLEVQKVSLQKNVAITDKDKAALNESQVVFLNYQNQLKNLNDEILTLQKSKHSVQESLDTVNAKLKEQRKLANKEYKKLSKKHQYLQAKLQVGFLLIIFAISLLLLRRYYRHSYAIMFKAITIAIIIKIFITMHDLFPSEYFKYLLILSLIALVIYAIKKLIQAMVSPKLELLMKKYREAYEHFLCPICEFPIQMGPRRFLFWTRRTNLHLKLPKTKEWQDFETYHCPMCSTELFQQCPSCQKVRHTLLSSCSHCGQHLTVKD